jgi:hypothetical protein
VHLATHRATQERRRGWAGLTVALTVTFTVCDAQQSCLSASDCSVLGAATVEVAQPVVPEQKTAPTLAPFRGGSETMTCRKQPAENTRPYAYALEPTCLALPDRPVAFSSWHSTAGETTRGPPRWGPSFLC